MTIPEAVREAINRSRQYNSLHHDVEGFVKLIQTDVRASYDEILAVILPMPELKFSCCMQLCKNYVEIVAI